MWDRYYYDITVQLLAVAVYHPPTSNPPLTHHNVYNSAAVKHIVVVVELKRGYLWYQICIYICGAFRSISHTTPPILGKPDSTTRIALDSTF